MNKSSEASLSLSHLDKLVFNETTALLPFHRYRSSHFITTALNAVVGAQLKEPGVLVEFSSSSRRLIVSSSRESLVNSVEFFRAKERTAGEGEGEKKARPVTSFVDDGKTNRLFEGEPLQKLSFQPGFHSRGGFKARLSLNRAWNAPLWTTNRSNRSFATQLSVTSRRNWRTLAEVCPSGSSCSKDLRGVSRRSRNWN